MTKAISKFYKFLIVASPWVLLVELFHYHFQSFLGYPGLFRGPYAFDLFTGIDLFVVLFVLVFAVGLLAGQVKISVKKFPVELIFVIGLLLFACVLQIFYQDIFEPILSTPYKYFRSLFLFPLIFSFLIFTTAKEKTVKNLVKSYMAMVGFFCLVALFQFITGIFPGEQSDFMGRLVWPYIDFVTLKSTSANWVAFFTTPAFILAFAHGFQTLRSKDWRDLVRQEDFWLYLNVFILAGAVIYLTQSYGAYVAVFVAITIYLFKAFKFKNFLAGFFVLVLLGGGVYLLQQNTQKYKVLAGEVDYRFETSATGRAEIYEMNSYMINERPIIGVGLNQYQSYFAAEHEKVLGHKYNESHIPPHAHNFFMSMWTSLGIFGFLAMLVLAISIFGRSVFNVSNPAVFAFTAIMVHGIIDSYYWKQEIAYVFWLIVVLSYLYRVQKAERL